MENKKTFKIHFLGAAGTVTGSKFLIDDGIHKILVDCGLFQGIKKLRLLNWEYLPVNAEKIDLVLLTHGHLDHTGYLPRLVKMGFSGPVLGTQPTLDIAKIILRDSAKIHEEEADKANENGYSKHSPALPLYDQEDAERAIGSFRPVQTDHWVNLFDDIRVRFIYNGHIIGSTFIEIEIHGKRLLFSGDIGRSDDFIMRPPEKPDRADVICVESTYGDRLHPNEDIKRKIREIVQRTYDRGGTLLIPSFAVERAQLLMYLLWQLKLNKEIPDIPMIMDSPMGADVLSIFHDHQEWHKLELEECSRMCNSFRIVKDFRETWEIINDPGPKIVIAGSGMLNGGRILTYLTRYLEKEETSILLAGFQAEGTRGRHLLRGGAELKIYGKYYKAKAEIHSLMALSAHADQDELVAWLSEIKGTPEKVFIVHGESHASDIFRVKLKDRYGWDCTIPELYSIQEIEY